MLTIPLARLFPNLNFLGIDSDKLSKNKSNLMRINNIEFMTNDEFYSRASGLNNFDLIIASEVIEPVEDPENFIIQTRKLSGDKGYLILTLPNGYGEYEIMTALEAIFKIIRIHQILGFFKKFLKRELYIKSSETPVDTSAVSPHINFFSYTDILKLIESSGFKVLKYTGRTVFCGFVFDTILKSEKIIEINAKLARYSSTKVGKRLDVSVREKRSNINSNKLDAKSNKYGYKNSAYAKIKRFLAKKMYELM